MNLASPAILEEGLFSALDGPYFKDLLKNSNIGYQIKLSGKAETLSDAHEIAIFRIVQEAVTNTIKYSQAEKFSVELFIEDKNIKLNIKDNGIGSQNHNQEELSGGFGLSGIRERVFAFSGKIALITENGFDIAIEIPISNNL